MNVNQLLSAANVRNLSCDQLQAGYNLARARLSQPWAGSIAVARADALVCRLESEIRRRDWCTYSDGIQAGFMVGPASDFVPIPRDWVGGSPS